jgi:ATP-binding cassette subfamily F protein uup
MREERRDRRLAPGTLHLLAPEVERSGKLVIEAESLGYRWAEAPLIENFSCLIMRGDRVGVVGPSGAGKSTLLGLLLGRLKPHQGRVRLGSRLAIAYFDQLRQQLDPEKTVAENVADGKETFEVAGKRRHVIGYLKDFLFSPDRARSPVKTLSGGERNRLLLARIFIRPSNLLVLDEPTNDLDIESLELLEEMLLGYGGTLLVVSHDRAFLNNVVTSVLAFEGGGRLGEYVGGYDDWLAQRPPAPAEERPAGRRPEPERRSRQRKLTFNEKRELDALPGCIEGLEAEQAAICAAMADPNFLRRGGSEIAAGKDRLAAIEAELEAAYARWEQLAAIGE